MFYDTISGYVAVSVERHFRSSIQLVDTNSHIRYL
uniref:Uncharacterized protein n=1 Tax=Siphoviridae sp. ctNiB4 TaxID=2823575 RepID=A0A8S5L793_9CAUD|nr:MAG TPA: hypothetical protein [Siphoviridae sp. ctNiB4]